jgi:hypothetical protein
VLEPDLWIFLGNLEDMRVEVAKGSWEQERGAIEIDHRLHGFFDRVGLRDLLFLDHLDARPLQHLPAGNLIWHSSLLSNLIVAEGFYGCSATLHVHRPLPGLASSVPLLHKEWTSAAKVDW